MKFYQSQVHFSAEQGPGGKKWQMKLFQTDPAWRIDWIFTCITSGDSDKGGSP